MKKSCAFLALSVFAGNLLCFPAAASGMELADTPKNHAPEARSIYASSEYSSDYRASFAADGIVRRQDMRLPNWVTNYQKEGTLTLTWDTEQILTRVLFYDIGDMTNRVEGVTMTFDNGTVLELGALNNNGSPKGLDFEEPIRTSGVEIHVRGTAQTEAVGLSEVEFFDEAGNNVAPSAAAEADSEAYDGTPYWFIPVTYEGWYAAENAVNGWSDFTLPKKTVENEWASSGEACPEITFTWDEPIQIGTVVLMDRVSTEDCVWGGEISFDEGDPISFEAIDNFGDPYFVDIPDITTAALTISVTDSSGPNIGFSEIEVYTEHFDEEGNVILNIPDDPEETPQGEEIVPSDSPAAESPAELPDVGALSIVLCGIFVLFILSALLSVIRPKSKKL